MIKRSHLLRRAASFLPAPAVKYFGRPVALFFHGVAARISDPRIEINHHTAESFRRIATELKRKFQVLPLTALNDVLKSPERHPHAVFLMADDGYANTLSAADILDELKLPWTLFVSTEHIDTGELNPLIFARLFVHFVPEGEYALPHLQEKVTLRNADDRARASPCLLDRLKRLPVAKARASIAAMKRAFSAGQIEVLRCGISDRALSHLGGGGITAQTRCRNRLRMRIGTGR